MSVTPLLKVFLREDYIAKTLMGLKVCITGSNEGLS